jgi:hypothetical protein
MRVEDDGRMRFRPTIAILSILVVMAVGVGILAVHRSTRGSVAIKSSTANAHLSAHARARAAEIQASRTAIARIPSSQGRADAVARQGRSQYRSEIGGFQQRAAARGVARNTALIAALQASRLPLARSIATSLLYRANHISHIEIVRGGQSIVSVGKGFVVGAQPVGLRTRRGASLGTLEVSIQDVIGFVRLLHRRTGADVIVRGNGGRVSSSIQAGFGASLPSRGAVTLAGRRYHVASFSVAGLLGEPLTVWVLSRG